MRHRGAEPPPQLRLRAAKCQRNANGWRLVAEALCTRTRLRPSRRGISEMLSPSLHACRAAARSWARALSSSSDGCSPSRRPNRRAGPPRVRGARRPVVRPRPRRGPSQRLGAARPGRANGCRSRQPRAPRPSTSRPSSASSVPTVPGRRRSAFTSAALTRSRPPTLARRERARRRTHARRGRKARAARLPRRDGDRLRRRARGETRHARREARARRFGIWLGASRPMTGRSASRTRAELELRAHPGLCSPPCSAWWREPRR